MKHIGYLQSRTAFLFFCLDPHDAGLFVLGRAYNFLYHGEVKLLVIPEFYWMQSLKCSILAVDVHDIPRKNLSYRERSKYVLLDIDHILKWSIWKRSDSFLNFGNGYITQRYLDMILT